MAGVVLQPGEKVVGIDLGTTNSCLATLDAGNPAIVPNMEGERYTPSVVAFTKDGELLVGEVAKRQAVLNPHSTYQSVKRFMGRTFHEVRDEAALVPYKVLDVDGKARLDCPALGQQLDPEQVSAWVLEKLCVDAEEYLSAKVLKAVITVPAYFNDKQRQATKAAGELAGLEVMRVVSEPTMAALAYGLDQRNFSMILVVDLGGGTLDVSCMEVGDGVCEALATSGDMDLGGNDFDRRIVDWVVDSFRQKEGIDLRQDGQAMSRVAEASERAKIELSQLQEARISVPFVAADEEGPKHVDETLTREHFDDLCQDIVERIEGPILMAMKGARCRPKDVAEVVLVGGSCRVPAVQEKVKELVPQTPLNSCINPDEVVAVGAAVQAAMIAGEVENIMLIDVTPLTLGVETAGGVFSTVIERNTAIPTKSVRIFTTHEDCQDSIEVVVLQGERPMAADNKKLDTFRLEGIPPAPAGVPKIEVAFKIDRNGILSVSAQDWATRKSSEIRVVGAMDVAEEKVGAILQEAEDSWIMDEYQKERIELANSAKCLVSQTQMNLAELGHKVPQDVRNIVEPRVLELEEMMQKEDAGIDHAQLKVKVEELRFQLMRAGMRIWGNQVAPNSLPAASRGGRPAGSAAPQRSRALRELINCVRS